MLHVVTHNDLDGVASAAIYISLARKALGPSAGDPEVHFAEPPALPNVLRSGVAAAEGDTVAFMDLGMNGGLLQEIAARLSEMAKRGVRVEWYDHHVWEPDWAEAIREAGAQLFVDTSTCGAGVVFKYAFPGVEREECHPLIVEATCAADLWRWDSELAPLFYRATRMPRGPRGDSFRRYLVAELSNCRLLSDELIERAERSFDRELEGYARVVREARLEDLCGERVGIIYRELDHPGISLSANYLISRAGLGLAVVVKPDGSVSFRSRKGVARKFALCFGGGGHPNASGGRVPLSAIERALALLPFVRKRLLLRRVARRLRECCSGKS